MADQTISKCDPLEGMEMSRLVNDPVKSSRYFSLVDIEKLSQKESTTNADKILAIIDIGECKKKYNYEGISNNTRDFWKAVMEQTIFQRIFPNYRSETLRKYWRYLRKSKNTLKCFAVVNLYSELIDSCDYNSLLFVVEAVALYVLLGYGMDFPEFFNIMINAKKIKKQNTKKAKSSNPPKLLSKKTKHH